MKPLFNSSVQSYLKINNVRTRHCCNSVVSCCSSWHQQFVPEHVTKPSCAVMSSNKIKMTVVINPHPHSYFWRMQGNFSLHLQIFLSPIVSILCVDSSIDVEMSLFALQNIRQEWQIISLSYDKTNCEFNPLKFAHAKQKIHYVSEPFSDRAIIMGCLSENYVWVTSHQALKCATAQMASTRTDVTGLQTLLKCLNDGLHTFSWH